MPINPFLSPVKATAVEIAALRAAYPELDVEGATRVPDGETSSEVRDHANKLIRVDRYRKFAVAGPSGTKQHVSIKLPEVA